MKLHILTNRDNEALEFKTEKKKPQRKRNPEKKIGGSGSILDSVGDWGRKMNFKRGGGM